MLHTYNMAQLMTKRIPLSQARWEQLGDIKQAGQTYDDLLADMVIAYNRSKLVKIAKEAKKGKGSWTKLEDL